MKTVYRDKLEWQVLDKTIAPDFQAIAKIRPGEFSVVDRDLGDKTWLVAYRTDNVPVYYYTYLRDSKKSQLLFSNQPKLEGLSLAQMKPISYQSRDGLTIHGYLTTPVGIDAKNLPTVLLVHGFQILIILHHQVFGTSIVSLYRDVLKYSCAFWCGMMPIL